MRACIIILTSLVGVGLVGLLDWHTGNEVALSTLCLLPIGIAVWFLGKWAGVFFSGLAAALWLTFDLTGGNAVSHPLIPY